MNADTVQIQPGPVAGTVRVPGSKSVTHRAFLLAAQSPEPCTVVHPLRSADTNATLACLHHMGFAVRPEERAVRFLPAAPAPATEPLDCRNSGTTLRLLTGTAARFPWTTLFDGDASLSVRPNRPLLDALRGMGATIGEKDTVPYAVEGPLHPGDARLGPGLSSQYGSSLLLSMPFLPGDSTLTLDAPVASGPYLDVTLDVAAAFGLRIEPLPDLDGGRTYFIPGRQVPRAASYTVEADWSTAAFPLVAGAVAAGPVTVEGLRMDSRQGDQAILDHLRDFGATVAVDGDSATVTADPGDLESPGSVDVAATPDLFPILTVLAAAARGTTTFTGGASLRHKESDRIQAMHEGLERMGVSTRPTDDGMVVEGKAGQALGAATLHTFDDHRIHMALAIAARLADGPCTLDGAGSAAVSHPGFHTDLAHLTEAAA